MAKKKAINNFENKAIRSEDTENKTQVEELYFFPSLGVSVRAKSREEALEKAKQISKK